ncbi:hypothetical protein TBLA_0E01710 [Henningerozyma blattae CBS 6284]|uniref:PIN domain-containing protein n=1 Tax=Henningerozyma blattae (strain ATCC 34711 / CBS 6284 / DSM 70876 / NBRC 10599 / NRRL Y-10934 / UCD 77-7) TaxID=1071380 RepID=I2H4C6_HENB6|nr:hypothetical protein TBLA_0E01710 [Tetrapisispora blattae CBS 6284]CCH61228.1 hypothetical protein TBLA_0E01710 [Tetrapisispora blattae CBS 6284]
MFKSIFPNDQSVNVNLFHNNHNNSITKATTTKNNFLNNIAMVTTPISKSKLNTNSNTFGTAANSSKRQHSTSINSDVKRRTPKKIEDLTSASQFAISSRSNSLFNKTQSQLQLQLQMQLQIQSQSQSQSQSDISRDTSNNDATTNNIFFAKDKVKEIEKTVPDDKVNTTLNPMHNFSSPNDFQTTTFQDNHPQGTSQSIPAHNSNNNNLSASNESTNQQNYQDNNANNNSQNDQQDSSQGNNNNNNNNNSNNNNNNNQQNSIKKSNQNLIQKLQNIYKLIVSQELELQDKCNKLSTSQSTKLKYLWSIYKLNHDLINNYILFILTSLSPSQSINDQLIGKEILEIYKIERRLWIYGTITFLDILKNFANFMDPEILSQFITHVFESISNMISDLPIDFINPWYQRLGDLSRMAIALYPSNFIDWKLSSEYWYIESMKFTFSHGKLYYHISTVQQNPLEAFVNLGKSVFCFDTFIPSQRYMQLVIDNIYQRAFIERNSNSSSSNNAGSSSNPNHFMTSSFAKNFQQRFLIEYLKHSEVMLLPNFLENDHLKTVVLNYFTNSFGKIAIQSNLSDPSNPNLNTNSGSNTSISGQANIENINNGHNIPSSSNVITSESLQINAINLFNFRNIFKQKNSDILKYFFKNSATFAESHILQLIGFGDPKNPFALLFQLPKYLKERKTKRKSKASNSNSNMNTNTTVNANISSNTIPSSDVSMKYETNSDSSNPTNSKSSLYKSSNSNIVMSSSTTSFATAISTTNNSISSNMDVDTELQNNGMEDEDEMLDNLSPQDFFNNLESLKLSFFLPNSLEIWNESLKYINIISLNCSIIVLKKFLNGPLFVSLPHMLPWSYFIISLALRIESLENIESRIFWLQFIRKIFPWNSIVSYLNVIISVLLDNCYENSMITKLINNYSNKNLDELLVEFNENEYELPEVWKCYGSLWFDVIAENYQIYSRDCSKNISMKDTKCLNYPIDGLPFDEMEENGTNFWKRSCRLIFLFKTMITRFNGFGGLTISSNTSVYCNRSDIPNNHILRTFAFKLLPDDDNYMNNSNKNSHGPDNSSNQNTTTDVMVHINQDDSSIVVDEDNVMSMLDSNLDKLDSFNSNNNAINGNIMNNNGSISIDNSDENTIQNVIINDSNTERNIDTWIPFEKNSIQNTDLNCEPGLSLIENESLFEYEGYKRFIPDFSNFDKNGELISTSLYTSTIIDTINGSSSNANIINTTTNANDESNNDSSATAGSNQNKESSNSTTNIDNKELFLMEKEIFNKILDPDYKNIDEIWRGEMFHDTSIQFSDTYFVLDATSWLRHFAHVYKLATNGILKFAICLTTFQELRFLRKSKDENVMEAATRAIITLRQLYSEKRLLPLRFTGNIATHIEEHLEFEEQITWRSHVDEFVIEAIKRAQLKRRDNRNQEDSNVTSSNNNPIINNNENNGNLNVTDMIFVLVTDDISMIKKRQEEKSDNDIITFSTKFVFSLCNMLVNKFNYPREMTPMSNNNPIDGGIHQSQESDITIASPAITNKVCIN